MYVMITGASRGIGKSLAETFAKHKYNLILTCKNNIDSLKELKIDFEKKYGVDIKIIKGNIYDENFIEDNEITEDIKKDIYIVINNQSIADYNLLQDTDKASYDNIIDSNVTNAVFTTKYFLPFMIANKNGIIANITSVWGEVGASGEVIYSLTKGSINTFTKALAKELEPSNIDVVGYVLGMVDTDMNKHLSEEEKIKAAKELNINDNGTLIDSYTVSNRIYKNIASRNYHTGELIRI